jgi:hypothetical protein
MLIKMRSNNPFKNWGPSERRRRKIVGTALVGSLVIVWGVVGILIVDKGAKGSLSAIFTSTCFAIILLLYWRNQT